MNQQDMLAIVGTIAVCVFVLGARFVASVIILAVLVIAALRYMPAVHADESPLYAKPLPNEALRLKMSVAPLITCNERPTRWVCTTRDGRRFDIIKTADELKVQK
jgi:hypothetical protein